MRETLIGWWSVTFDLKLDGKEVRWHDLSKCTQEHIIECIKDGCNQGQIVEEYGGDDDDPCDGCANDCTEVCESCPDNE